MKLNRNKKIIILLMITITFINYIHSISLKNTNENTNKNSKSKSLSLSLSKTNTFSSTNLKTYLTLQNSLLSTREIKVINIIKKSPRISTEGLFYEDGNIYESGFYKNKSFLLKKNYENKKIIKTIPLLSLSGKGIAKCGNKFYQLTEKEKKIISYTYPDLNLIASNSLDSDMLKGEGLSNLSENNLVATDGSNNLYILDCQDEIYVIKTIAIYDLNGAPMFGLQDLTVVDEFVYANRENDNRILKIDPKNGGVVKTYDLMNLINYELKMKSLSRNDIAKGSVLNGITYDKNRKLFILTGRNWAFYYEVKLD
jgi:glutamine cyclotransferase